MSGFVLAPAARADLRKIQRYIARDNVTAARGVIAELRAACARLAEYPQMGHVRDDLTDQPVKFWPVRAYYIVYRPATDPLEIVRALHGARDIERIL